MTDTLPSVQIELLEPGGELRASFEPAQSGRVPDRPGLDAELQRLGFAGFELNTDAINEFLRLCAEVAGPVSLVIGGRRDGRCDIAVSDDAMTAWLTLTPAAGGLAVDAAQVARALQDSGVCFGIDDAAIARALAKGVAVTEVVARGRPAERGAPAQFRSLVPDIQRRGPRVNERGVANYREVSSLVIVHAGDPLMQRTPATAGRAGSDVLGLVIPAEHGDDPPFSPTLSGASSAQENPDLLVAAISGQPLLQQNGVSVEPTITLASVDISIGNVDFDGTVNITGDIAAGMRVRASGDVHVAGSVEAAEIEAGGNIVVMGGVIGNAERGTTAGKPGTPKTRLQAKGSVKLRFCEGVTVEAGTDLLIDEVALHSDLTALNQIVIGKPGARKNQLIGGHARTTARLVVGTLGSSAGIKTRVQVGYHPHVHAQLAELQHQLDLNAAKQDDLKKIIAYTESATGQDRIELREKAQRTLESFEQARLDLAVHWEELQATRTLTEAAHVQVGQHVHPGVEVQLGGRVWHARETQGPGTIRLVDDGIVYG